MIGRLILGVRTHQTHGWRGKKKTNKRGKRPLIITPPRTKKQKNTTLLTLSSARVRLLYPAWGFSTVLVWKTCDYLKSLSLFTQLGTATLLDMAKNKHFQSAWGIVRTSSRSCPVDSLWSSVEMLFCWRVALSWSINISACFPRLSYSFLRSVEISIVLSVPVNLQWTREPAKIDVHKIGNVSKETTAEGKRKQRRSAKTCYNRMPVTPRTFFFFIARQCKCRYWKTLSSKNDRLICLVTQLATAS